MKCKSFVKFIPARKRGSGELYQKAVKIFPRYNIKLGALVPEPDMIECDGNLEITVEPSMEGDCYCSSYAVLHLVYKCKKCGNTFFEELPRNEKELSILLQSFFEELPENLRDKMLDNRIEKKIEKQKEIEKYHEERRKRDEENFNKVKDKKKKKRGVVQG
jgi:hypothetical protein